MGTDAWRNWKAFDADEPETENADDDIYSDRHFVGGPSTYGPYTLSIIVGRDWPSAAPVVRPAAKLHVGVHTRLIPDIVVNGELVAANSDAYHGGNASDEIAALISLDLGVRLRVAGTSRLSGFHENGADQLPIYLEVAPLAHPGRPGHEHVPAALNRPANLGKLHRLHSFPQLDEAAQVALVRAARAYAAGLWWANEDPNQAWLQFVSAAEVAASFRQQVLATPQELVERLWPELWKVLHSTDETVRTDVSTLVAPQVRATRKFIDFLTECAPHAPELQPSFDTLDWSQMASHARIIYGHRSTALHEGKPFPMPMLQQPRVDENGAVQEVPGGLNSGGLGGVWDAKECPMLLSTFEHVARGALLRWWDELAGV